jgi:hypothetical protein
MQSRYHAVCVPECLARVGVLCVPMASASPQTCAACLLFMHGFHSFYTDEAVEAETGGQLEMAAENLQDVTPDTPCPSLHSVLSVSH